MFKNLLLAAAMVLSFGSVGAAATINGQIDIGGTINLPTSNFSATGNVDLNNPGLVLNATGSFSGLSIGSFVTLADINFTAPELSGQRASFLLWQARSVISKTQRPKLSKRLAWFLLLGMKIHMVS